MKTYHVTAVGLGGPSGEFIQRQYEVQAETPGGAIDIAIPVFASDCELESNRWKEKRPYFFHSAEVWEADAIIRKIA